MFDLHPDVEPILADPSIPQALRDAPLPERTATATTDRAADGIARMRAAVGRRLIAAGAALLPDEPVRRPVARP